jgi:hypothetical protein
MSERAGPDLSSFGSELPLLEDLYPEELRYLCDLCTKLQTWGVCHSSRIEPHDDAHYDADELGLDPEED